MKSAGDILALDISKYVKQFAVALQIYMADVNATVKNYSCELFNVWLLVFHKSSSHSFLRIVVSGFFSNTTMRYWTKPISFSKLTTTF